MAHMGDWRGAYMVLVTGPDGKGSDGGPRSIWEDNGSSGSGMGRHGLD